MIGIPFKPSNGTQRPPEIDLDDESDVHLAEAVLDMWQQYYSYVAGEQQYPAHTLSVAVVVEVYRCTVLLLTREQAIVCILSTVVHVGKFVL